MGLLERFRRRKTIDIEDPLGMGDDDGDYEPGEGGPSVFKADLAAYRWMAQQEAVNIARRGVDPERWDDGRMSFEFERAMAHGHEGMRDRLSNYVGQRVRDEVRELYEKASDVAQIRDDLRRTDNDLVNILRDWRQLNKDLSDDELEVGRYYRARSQRTRAVKYLIFAAFVISEFIISGYIFDQVITTDIPGLGFLFAVGLMVLLIVIPHYAAQGIKEGITHFHSFEKTYLEKCGEEIPYRLERQVHHEERDDSGFRFAASILGVLLIVMIVPLSMLRSDEIDEGRAWFWFFMLLQLGISGYFFLREWLDHGSPSHNLLKLTEEKERLEEVRAGVLADLGDAVADFHDTAEDLIFTLQQAPRWDSQIVEAYNESLRYFRHLVTIEHPEAEQFITWARMPYLGSKTTVDDSEYPLDPVSEEHRSLEEDGPLGREWLLRQAAESLARTPREDDEDEDVADEPDEAREGGDVNWLVTKSPDELLSGFLDRYFDIPAKYTRPPEIDGSPDDAGQEPAPREPPGEVRVLRSASQEKAAPPEQAGDR